MNVLIILILLIPFFIHASEQLTVEMQQRSTTPNDLDTPAHLHQRLSRAVSITRRNSLSSVASSSPRPSVSFSPPASPSGSNETPLDCTIHIKTESPKSIEPLQVSPRSSSQSSMQNSVASLDQKPSEKTASATLEKEVGDTPMWKICVGCCACAIVGIGGIIGIIYASVTRG